MSKKIKVTGEVKFVFTFADLEIDVPDDFEAADLDDRIELEEAMEKLNLTPDSPILCPDDIEYEVDEAEFPTD